MSIDKKLCQTVIIEYAHCILWTQGQLDCAPWSKYELRQETVNLLAQPGLIDDLLDYTVSTPYGMMIADGDSENEAINNAQYYFMHQSREYTRQHAASGSKLLGT